MSDVDIEFKAWFRATFPAAVSADGSFREPDFSIAQAAYTQGLFDANEGNGEQKKAIKCCGCGKEQEKASNARHGAGRKFWALLICLLAVFVCGIFEFDITMAVVGLYGLYVGGNVSQKVGVSVAEHGDKKRD